MEIRGQVCSRCIYDESVPGIQFDERGVCSYCHQMDHLAQEYGTGTDRGLQEINQWVERIRRAGRGKRYDCVVGVSGGTDSSYLLHWAVEQGLRPLAVHYDNTWNTSIANQNIRKMLDALNLDLDTYVVDHREADDLIMAFFRASVPEIEAPTDLALAEVLYRSASKHRVSYILEGHSFMTEGISPLGKNYFDGKYIQSIHAQYGRVPMKTYPLMDFKQFMRWTLWKRIRKIRPLWYIGYNKEAARKLLEARYGWTYYGGHHLENRATAFFHQVYCPRKFQIDYRNNSLSAQVRNGKLSRQEAIEIYQQAPFSQEIQDYFCKRLGLSSEAFEQGMAAPPRYWQEFPTYKQRFEQWRPLFYLLMKAQLVPRSFYQKYCFPSPLQTPA